MVEYARLLDRLSIGVAGKGAEEYASQEGMIDEADRCLYLAKEAGRNRSIAKR